MKSRRDEMFIAIEIAGNLTLKGWNDLANPVSG